MQINFGLPNILLHKTKLHTLLIPVKNRHDIKLKEYFVFFARLCTSCSLVAVSKIMAFIAIVQLISFIQVTNVYRMDQSALWVYIIQTIINEYISRRHAVSTLQKQVGHFNLGVVTVVADKLKVQ